MTAVIECNSVRKSYRTGSVTTPVLNGVDLRVEEGECVFLAGHSGGGKTTLLSILGCILSVDEGLVRILGSDVTSLNRKQKARFRREKMGFVFQRFHLIHGLKAWENVHLPYALLGSSSSNSKSEARRLLDIVGLADRADFHIGQLSMGQRQRVALARALAGDPGLILADEPTASLDAETGLTTMQLLKDLTKKNGKTAFVVTHDSRIFHLADRILYLENGLIGRESSGPFEDRQTPVVFATTR